MPLDDDNQRAERVGALLNTILNKLSRKKLRGNELNQERVEVKGLVEEAITALASPASASTPLPARTVATAEPPSDGEAVDFGEFFEEVGKSVIEAQRQLDKGSAEYLRASARSKHILPTVFRIPKLKAEVKFAFGKRTGTKINLLFFGKKEEAESMHQQSVSLEIAAAPPPPELAGLLQRLTPHIDLVFDPSTREGIIETLTTELGMPASHTVRKNPNRLLVVALPETENAYLVLFATKVANNKGLGLWRIETEARTASELYQFSVDGRPGDDLRPVKAFVGKLADLQEELLAILTPVPSS